MSDDDEDDDDEDDSEDERAICSVYIWPLRTPTPCHHALNTHLDS